MQQLRSRLSLFMASMQVNWKYSSFRLNTHKQALLLFSLVVFAGAGLIIVFGNQSIGCGVSCFHAILTNAG